MDDLDGPVRRALHDARLDLSLEFQRAPDGTKSGALLIADASGATIVRVPLESPEAMNVALARLVQLGFGDAAAPPPLPKPETSVLVAGVDGYRQGWVAVALDPSGDVQVSTHASFSEVLSSQARVIAVDIPIDPPGLGVRQADAGARAFVGGSRASSVFPTPPRRRSKRGPSPRRTRSRARSPARGSRSRRSRSAGRSSRCTCSRRWTSA